MSLGAEQKEVVPQQKLQTLLQQYRECSAHHVCMYQLMWQVPAVTVTASGLLVAAAFGYNVPSAARLAVALMGTAFVFMMAVAIERNRMFQMRRRKDMLAIEQEFALVGVQPISWEFASTLEETERGEFPSTGGLRLYRLDFFVILRTLMYALIVLLATLSGLALADLLGAEIFD
jgi:hypothetical protein